ncbi:BON domain-containing protein [Oceanimonas sp. CHS3-5]|uniref:BON domain-containing protein n=1 Tax=Oceanimonas sp. CHS3-5 TaxID=3068186 RepID=UPI00273D99A1|nr:BON domain-containing protein [Oceanimonas sp. CHS3-5]MDP5291893.1 BON domain-containing protein [Oceanimonas sp. CHS3-5]
MYIFHIQYQQLKLMMALGGLLLLAVFSASLCAQTQTRPYEMSDIRMETQIWTTYILSPYLRANDLLVVVQDGEATLTGVVDEAVNKELAEEIALGVEGITSVNNDIQVKAGYALPAPTGARSYGERVDDISMTAAVKSKLLWSKHADGLAVEVTTERGKVTLKGAAGSVEAKEFAERQAASTRGVLGVDNQLRIDPNITKNEPKETGKGAGHGMSDSWITMKVKATFMYSSNVSSSDIAVTTEDGVVHLSGKVHSGAERALAIEHAQNIRGVKSVEAKALTF